MEQVDVAHTGLVEERVAERDTTVLAARMPMLEAVAAVALEAAMLGWTQEVVVVAKARAVGATVVGVTSEPMRGAPLAFGRAASCVKSNLGT